MMISYAGNFEDVLLTRLFGVSGDGFYIDIGACHARNGNASWVFYERGWRGVCVEPGPLFETLAALRPGDVNLRAAISDADGEADFHFHPEIPAISSILGAVPPTLAGRIARRETCRVPTMRLDTLVARHVGARTVDFPKVDAEGSEAAVFAGTDFRRFRPRVIVAEATAPFTNDPVHEAWSGPLQAAGYRVTLFDGINLWLVREEAPDLAARAALPVNQLDFFRPYDDEKLALLEECAALRARVDTLVAAAPAAPCGQGRHLAGRLLARLGLGR